MSFEHVSHWSPLPQIQTQVSSPGLTERDSQSEVELTSEDLKVQLQRAERLGHHPEHYAFISGGSPLQSKPQPQPEPQEEETEVETSEPEISFAADTPSPPGSSDAPSGAGDLPSESESGSPIL